MNTITQTVILISSVCVSASNAAQTTPLPPFISATQAADYEAPKGSSALDQAQSNVIEAGEFALDHSEAAADLAVKVGRRVKDWAQSKLAMADFDSAEPLELHSGIENSFGFAVAAPGHASAQPLVIRGGEFDSNVVTHIQEDLTVMSRILNKTIEREIGREGRDSAMGIVLSAIPGSRRPQSIYLEGYGALFLLSVKFPLVPPPAKEDEKTEKAADSTWEQTRRELYGPRTTNVRIWNVPGNDATAEYDSEQVENLKKQLMEAMKNAANVRDLKPEESVTIAVLGSRWPAGFARLRQSGGQKGAVRKLDYYVADSDRGSARESTLTLRAKKSDIDAFAKGDLNFEQFKAKVAVAAY